MESTRENAFAVLRQFARKRTPAELCELCSQTIIENHPHLVEPASRRILCSCEPCAVLFSNQSDLRYKRVPRDSKFFSNFQMTDAEWDQFLIPIGMAFFFYSTPASKVIALYPAPAGAVESLLQFDAWENLVSRNPSLQKIEPDVEALLVNRIGAAREYYMVPIDECYRLVGLIRSQWKGLSGGMELWREINQFFAHLKERSSTEER